MTKPIEKLYVTNRDDWRKWLEKSHNTKKEIWLIYYKKHTGKSRIPYDDAVEEALCYGWIDSTVKKLDEETYAQKFTPRNTRSKWSELNIKRARKMIQEKRMTKAGLVKCKKALKNAEKKLKVKSPQKIIMVPPDLKKALTKNKKALKNFENFASSYRRLYIGWINSAKKQETKEKRISRVVEWSAKNQKPGML